MEKKEKVKKLSEIESLKMRVHNLELIFEIHSHANSVFGSIQNGPNYRKCTGCGIWIPSNGYHIH